MEHKGLDILMEHKDIYLYLMEHKDTKTQRIKQSIHSAKATHKKTLDLRVEKTLSLCDEKNFVSSCLCVQLKNLRIEKKLCVFVSLCSVKKKRVFVFS